MPKSHNLKYIAFIIPALVYVSALSIFPAALSVYRSFLTPGGSYTFSNYSALLHYGLVKALIDTMLVSIGALILQLFLALFIAMIMIKPFRGNRLFSSLVIIPYGISTVVSAFIFSQIFSAVGGYANSFIVDFGFRPIDWVATSSSSLSVVVIADYWKNTPLVALILFSGLSGLSPSMYEAAKTDGAGAFRRFFSITLPNLAPIMAIALLIRGVSEFNIFALPLVIIGYNPPLITTLIYEFYQTSSTTIYYSYAASTILLFIILGYASIVLWKGGAKSYER